MMVRVFCKIMNTQHLIKLFNDGESIIQIAINEGICISELFSIYENAYLNGQISNRPRKPYISDRDSQIIIFWNSGEHTYESIGDIYEITRERVRQVLLKHKRQGHFVLDTHKAAQMRHEYYINNQIKNVDIEEIQKLFLEGIPVTEITERMRISHEVLKTILKSLHKEEKISNKDRIFQQIKDSRENIGQLTKYRYSTVLKMRKENKKLSEIADELGLSKIRLTQIIRRMKDLGIEIPNSRDTGNPLDDKELLERLNEIEAYLNEDMSINQISIIMKMSPHNISNLIYKHFIKT